MQDGKAIVGLCPKEMSKSIESSIETEGHPWNYSEETSISNIAGKLLD